MVELRKCLYCSSLQIYSYLGMDSDALAMSHVAGKCHMTACSTIAIAACQRWPVNPE